MATKKLARKVFIGCSVTTAPGCLAEFGAQRAPYDTDTAACETVSYSPSTSQPLR